MEMKNGAKAHAGNRCGVRNLPKVRKRNDDMEQTGK